MNNYKSQNQNQNQNQNQELDLNINNYNLKEIQNFFGLGENYDFNDIVKNEKNITSVIISNKDYGKREKDKITNFIKSAKDILVRNLKNIISLTEQDELLEDFDTLLVKADEERVINKTSTTYGGHNYVMNKETISLNDSFDKTKYLNPIEAYGTHIARSTLNNLKKKTITQSIILNTLFREDYLNTSPSDFNITMPTTFKNVFSLRLSSIQLPNCQYCFSSKNKNNYFYVIELDTCKQTFIIIPDGNYKPEDFVDLLSLLINEALDTTNFIATYDKYTGKIKITNNQSIFHLSFLKDLDTIYLNDRNLLLTYDYNYFKCLDMTQLYRRSGWVMGFRQAEYAGSNSYETEGIYTGVYSEYLYFVLNDYNHSQSQNYVGMYSSSVIENNILAMIPLTLNNSDYIFFENGPQFIQKKREYFGPVNIQKLKVRLIDKYGEPVDTNFMDYTFSLELEIGYDW